MIIHVFIWHPIFKTIAIVSHNCDCDTGWSNQFIFSTLQEMHQRRVVATLSRTKIFVEFVVFEAPTNILSLKISYKLANPINLYRMRFVMMH